MNNQEYAKIIAKNLEATDQRDRDNKRDKARTKGYFFIGLCPFISLWPETLTIKVT